MGQLRAVVPSRPWNPGPLALPSTCSSAHCSPHHGHLRQQQTAWGAEPGGDTRSMLLDPVPAVPPTWRRGAALPAGGERRVPTSSCSPCRNEGEKLASCSSTPGPSPRGLLGKVFARNTLLPRARPALLTSTQAPPLPRALLKPSPTPRPRQKGRRAAHSKPALPRAPGEEAGSVRYRYMLVQPAAPAANPRAAPSTPAPRAAAVLPCAETDAGAHRGAPGR